MCVRIHLPTGGRPVQCPPRCRPAGSAARRDPRPRTHRPGMTDRPSARVVVVVSRSRAPTAERAPIECSAREAGCRARNRRRVVDDPMVDGDGRPRRDSHLDGSAWRARGGFCPISGCSSACSFGRVSPCVGVTPDAARAPTRAAARCRRVAVEGLRACLTRMNCAQQRPVGRPRCQVRCAASPGLRRF